MGPSEGRARPKRCSAGFRASFCFSFGQSVAGKQAEQNEKQNEHETKNTVEVGPCRKCSWVRKKEKEELREEEARRAMDMLDKEAKESADCKEKEEKTQEEMR